MKHQCINPCLESEKDNPASPSIANYVLGEKIDGLTIVSINKDANKITLRNTDMAFDKTGLPKNFTWHD